MFIPSMGRTGRESWPRILATVTWQEGRQEGSLSAGHKGSIVRGGRGETLLYGVLDSLLRLCCAGNCPVRGGEAHSTIQIHIHLAHVLLLVPFSPSYVKNDFSPEKDYFAFALP